MNKKMLDVSVLEDDKIRYNDDIAYVEGDDLYSTSPEEVPIDYTNSKDYSNYVVYQLGTQTYCPSMKYEDIDYTPGDLKYLTSMVECQQITLTKENLKDFDKVQITDYDPINDEMFEFLKNERYDGVCYYAETDTLIIPSTIQHYLERDGEVSVLITLYNMNNAIKKHSLFTERDYPTIPNLQFSYIPQTIKYSKLNIEMINGQIPAPKSSKEDLYFDFNYIYTNLPREYFKYIAIDSRALAYDINEEIFYGHSNSNQTKMNALCKDIAMNGFKSPIQLKLLSDGTLVSYFSNKRLLAGLYLNCPTLPVCIIYEPYINNRDIYHYLPTPNIEEMNKILYPYIILEE